MSKNKAVLTYISRRGFFQHSRSHSIDMSLRLEFSSFMDINQKAQIKIFIGKIASSDAQVIIRENTTEKFDAWSYGIHSLRVYNFLGCHNRQNPYPWSPIHLPYIEFKVISNSASNIYIFLFFFAHESLHFIDILSKEESDIPIEITSFYRVETQIRLYSFIRNSIHIKQLIGIARSRRRIQRNDLIGCLLL